MRSVIVGPIPSAGSGQVPDSSSPFLADLTDGYRLETVAHFQSPSAALAYVQAEPEAPEALIADVSALHDPSLDGVLVQLLDAVTLRWPGCRVAVVLGEAQRYLQGQIQHANSRVFQPGQPAGDLATYLGLPLRQEIRARIVLVLSAKGGVGKTTLVANLAAALAARHGLRVAVVDGDLTRGDLAHLLGVEPTATLLDLVNDRSPGGIHSALDRYLVHTAPAPEWPPEAGLALLPAPGGSIGRDQPWTALTTRHAQAILTALGSRFDVVLLDTPPDLQRSSPFPAAVLADEGLPFLALVVVQPQPMERLGARQVLDFLGAQPTPHGRVRGVLINRNRARGNPAHLARLLDVEVVDTIPYDSRAATAQDATDLVHDFGHSRLGRPARDYAQLADWIVEGQES